MENLKKVDCLVKLVWDAQRNLMQVVATGAQVVAPIPAGGLRSCYAQGQDSMSLHNMLVQVANAAVRSGEIRPNAYCALRVVTDVHGRAYDGAPFEDVFAFQLYRIPPAFLDDNRIHELKAETAYYDYADVK